MDNNYEQGFKVGVELAARKICPHCQKGWKLENLERDGKVRPYHHSLEDRLITCSAEEIRSLTPHDWPAKEQPQPEPRLLSVFENKANDDSTYENREPKGE